MSKIYIDKRVIKTPTGGSLQNLVNTLELNEVISEVAPTYTLPNVIELDGINEATNGQGVNIEGTTFDQNGSFSASSASITSLVSGGISLSKVSVSQLGTGVTTDVTCNAKCGIIETDVQSITYPNAGVIFTVNNSLVATTSAIFLQVNYSGAGFIVASVQNIQNGSFQIRLNNVIDGTSLNAAALIHFVIL